MSKVKSTRGNRAAQVFTNGKVFDAFYPVASKMFGYEGMETFFCYWGISDY